MFIDQVREYALSLPHTTERQPYGPDSLVIEICGKSFCLMDLSSHWPFYNLKVDPEYSVELREKYNSIKPAYHMNKKHWISVDFYGDVPDSLQRKLIVHAYRQTIKGLPKKLQATINADLGEVE